MPSPPPGRNKPGKTPSKLDRDTSKKNVALNKAQQKQEMARKVMEKKLLAEQKGWKKQKDTAEKLKKIVDGIMEKIKEDRTLDQRFMGAVKKLGAEIVKLDKQMSTFGKSAEMPKMFTEVQVAARKVPAPSTVQTYADLSLFLAMFIVILNRTLRLNLSDKKKK